MSQKNIDGYFGSGSGVASQEQVQSGRGLAKAFLEGNLSVPAVVRLGGNLEEEAVRIMQDATKELGVPVEGYTKDDSADFCAERMHKLITEFKLPVDRKSVETGLHKVDYEFETMTGSVQFDYGKCSECDSKICVKSCPKEILRLEADKPVLAIDKADAKKGKCTECLACEIDCRMQAKRGCYVSLPIENLEGIAEKSQ